MIWVFFGGGIGATLRYIVVNILTKAGIVNSAPAFPLPVMLINIVGSFAIGILAQIVSRETFANFTYSQQFLMVGILGGFTTFSAFSLETLNLLQAGKVGYAAIYVTSSVVLSILAAYVGYVLAK